MYTKTCIGCANSFDTANYRQTRCVKNCGRDTSHAARAAVRAEHDIEFIAVDGEGVTDDRGDHHYVLLSSGDTSYHRQGRPLHHDEIFEFLYDQYERNPSAAFVGFFLGYDFTQWLRTLTENRASMLLSPQGRAARAPRSANIHQPFMVTIGQEWDIDLLGDKRFKLRPHVGRGQKPEPTMYICDAGPFFQSSFLSVIDPKGWPHDAYPVDSRDYDLIVEGKRKRATAVFDSSMQRYNVAENHALRSVMGELNKGFVGAGVRLHKQQWFGPGQAASAWLKDHCDHTSDVVRDAMPPEVIDAAIGTYYGGWFEIFAHGHVPGPCYEYDINSAYPAAIVRLPCLLHGTWRHNGIGHSLWTLEYTTVTSCGDMIGAAPYRNADGAISRPRTVTGWYWSHEIDAQIAAGISRRVTVHERWTYDPCPCPPPMREVRDLYHQRIALGEKGKNSPQGKALKLLYNSMYGKFAQSVGKPRYANPVWASLITSLCRTEIVKLIGSHPRGIADVLMVATDAVFFRAEHTDVVTDAVNLGSWSPTPRHNLCLMMPGVYWDDTTRDALRRDEAPKLKSRGISAAALAACIDTIDDAFTAFHPEPGELVEWPAVKIPLDFAMVTATQAVARHNWETAGTLIPNASRRMSADPRIKRDPLSVWWDAGVLRTRRWDFTGVSAPYQKRFGMVAEAERADVPWSPDGDLSMLLHEGFDW